MTEDIPKLLTLEKAADAVGLTVTQFRWLRSQKSGPKGARIGGRVYFREEDLTAWISGHFATDDAA